MADELFPIDIVAKVMNVTVRRVQQLGLSGVIPRSTNGRLPILPCVTGYIKYLQQRESQGSKKLTEDARLRSAQADLRTLELAKARGDVVSKASTTETLRDVLAANNRAMAGAPARITPDLVGRSAAEIKQTLEHEHHAIQQTFYDGLVKLGGDLERRARSRRARKKTPARRVGRRQEGAPEGIG